MASRYRDRVIIPVPGIMWLGDDAVGDGADDTGAQLAARRKP